MDTLERGWEGLTLAPALIRSLRSCCDALSRYPEGDPMIRRNLSGFRELAYEWLIESDEVMIRLEEDIFSFNGLFLEPIHNRDPSVQWMRKIFQERRIHEIRILDGFTALDLRKLIEVLIAPSHQFRDTTVASQMMTSAGIAKVLVNPPSVDDSFHAVDTFIGLDGSEREMIPLAPPDSEAPEPTIDDNEREALLGQTRQMIAEGRANHVALMLEDLQPMITSRKEARREFGFSRYRVLVDALIEARQDTILYSTVKAVANHLREVGDERHFAMHLETYSRVLDFFRDRNYKPVVYGITALATLKQEKPERAPLIHERLATMLTPDYLLALLATARIDQGLRPYLEALLKRAPAIVDYLLEALATSEDKLERKLLLDALMRPGDRVFPDIIRRLRIAIADGAPWYLKRNLLTILASNPPPALIDPLLSMWDRERHPRVRALMERIVFVFDDERCIEIGRDLLKKADDKSLVRLIRFVEAGKVDDFAQDLIALFQSHDDPTVRQQALLALGRYGPGGRELLARVLGEKRRGKPRWPSQLRRAAIRALAEDPANLDLIAERTDDPDIKVRETAEVALAGRADRWRQS